MEQMTEKAKAPEILREELSMQRFAGSALSQAVVEGEVALPGGLREETHVLSAEAMAVLDRSLAEDGRVSADGRVTFHVLYTQGDPTHVHALEAAAEFTHATDLPAAAAGMSAPASLMVEHVQAAAQGGRLHLTAIVRICTRLFTDEPLSAVTGVRGADGLMTRSETLACVRMAAHGEQEVLVRDECDLGAVLQITDTLYATAVASVQDVMGGEDRATLSGQVLLEVTHTSAMPSRPLVVTRHTIPFEETIALSGESGDSLCCWAAVRDVAVLSQEGPEEGERTLRAEVLLGLNAQSSRTREVRLLLDAYTTSGDLLIPVSQPVSRVLSHRQVHTAESGKIQLVLEGQPPARTPLRATLRPVMTDWKRAGGRLIVEGMMDITLLYMTDDDPAPRTFHAEEPFRTVFACDLSLPDSLVLTPGSVEAVGVTSDRVEIRYILHLDCRDVQLAHEPLVTQITARSAESSEPGILLCFSREGESVWDIAKRYRVSPDSLRRMNPDLGEEAGAGRRVILWKRDHACSGN